MKQKEAERFDELIRQMLFELCGGTMIDCSVAQIFGKDHNTLEIKATYKDLVQFREITTTGPIAAMWESSKVSKKP